MEQDDIAEVYRDGYESAVAGHGMLLGNPHIVLTSDWHEWRDGYILGRRQNEFRDDQ